MQTWHYGVQTHWPVQILQYANLVAFTAFAVCQYVNMLGCTVFTVCKPAFTVCELGPVLLLQYINLLAVLILQYANLGLYCFNRT